MYFRSETWFRNNVCMREHVCRYRRVGTEMPSDTHDLGLLW